MSSENVRNEASSPSKTIEIVELDKGFSKGRLGKILDGIIVNNFNTSKPVRG